MPGWLMSAVRTGVQAGWGVVAAWLLARGVEVPAEAPAWVAGAAVAVVTGVVTAGIRWLETRSRSSRWGLLARRVARLLMLGIVQQPTYAARNKAL